MEHEVEQKRGNAVTTLEYFSQEFIQRAVLILTEIGNITDLTYIYNKYINLKQIISFMTTNIESSKIIDQYLSQKEYFKMICALLKMFLNWK